MILSSAETGVVEAVMDAGSVTALRTGAAAALAAETLGLPGASAAVVGAGVNGRACARSLKALGRDVLLWDVDDERATPSPPTSASASPRAWRRRSQPTWSSP